MAESTNEPPERKFVDPETALGGADAVEKTTYVVGHGTNPEAEAPRNAPSPVGTTGPSLFVWIVLAIAVLIAIVYVAGIAMRR